MEERRKAIYEKAKSIIKSISIFVSAGDADLIQYLSDLEKSEFMADEIDLIERTLENIEIYFNTKRKMVLEINDYEYLRELANTLREQKVRVQDGVIFGEPVFKLIVDDIRDEFYFMTRKGAEEFIKNNSTTYKDIKMEEIDKSNERRKTKLFDVKTNKNLEFAQIIEIIKRNF